MTSNQILKSDVLDIVFEKRNKAYGAYALRKYYPSRIKTALGIMFIIAIGFSAFTLLPAKKRVHSVVYEIPPPEIVKVHEDVKQPEKRPEVSKPEPLPPVDKPPVPTTAFLSNTLIVADNVKTDTIRSLRPEDVISNVTAQVTGSQPAVVTPAKNDAETGTTLVATGPKVDINKPMEADVVDVLPSFPGGIDALMKFLKKHLENPAEKDETVSVQIKFVVGYNGKLKSFVTVLDGGESYNREVVRVLKKMPDWIPGKAKGENVSVYYTIPVKFVPAD